MNVENILAVADAIEKHSIPDLGFNMAGYYRADGVWPDRSGHNCGTTACIAGWACAVAGSVPKSIYGISSRASSWLGLADEQDDELFIGNGTVGVNLDDVTPSQAVSVLRHLAETGEVDWARFTAPVEAA